MYILVYVIVNPQIVLRCQILLCMQQISLKGGIVVACSPLHPVPQCTHTHLITLTNMGPKFGINALLGVHGHFFVRLWYIM